MIAAPRRTPPSDTSAIVNAIIAVLGADPTLLALMPNGVYYLNGPNGATRFVSVKIQDATDVAEFGRRAIEDAHYEILATALSSMIGPDDMRAAAYRIDELLEDQPIAVTGYEWMTTHRVNPVIDKMTDPENPNLEWRYRGGTYHVVFAPTGAV